jgi:hypothetical protein
MATLINVASTPTVPLSETQYGPPSDPAYTINTSAMTAVDTTNLTTASFTVPSTGKIKVTVSGSIKNASTLIIVYLAMLNHSGGAQVGDTCSAGCTTGYSSPTPFTKIYLITGLTPSVSLQLDLAMYTPSAGTTTLSALVTTTPAKNDAGPITILIENA